MEKSPESEFQRIKNPALKFNWCSYRIIPSVCLICFYLYPTLLTLDDVFWFFYISSSLFCHKLLTQHNRVALNLFFLQQRKNLQQAKTWRGGGMFSESALKTKPPEKSQARFCFCPCGEESFQIILEESWAKGSILGVFRCAACLISHVWPIKSRSCFLSHLFEAALCYKLFVIDCHSHIESPGSLFVLISWAAFWFIPIHLLSSCSFFLSVWNLKLDN